MHKLLPQSLSTGDLIWCSRHPVAGAGRVTKIDPSKLFVTACFTEDGQKVEYIVYTDEIQRKSPEKK